MPSPVEVLALPFPLEPSPHEVRWTVEQEPAAVAATAAPRTDVFVDPGTGSPTLNAATLLGAPPAGDFRFSARVTVDFAATFDAGVLLLWLDERTWAKLCFEFSPDGEPMVVSVVCRGVADDANAFVVDGRSVRLRITRTGRAFAFHASTDGTRWRLIRHFALAGDASAVRLGFEVQSPTGDGCAVRFDDVRFTPEGLADLRDGS
jgi:regulation of enolase protein 1 (concanavalin A-like superfamily)